MRNGNMSTCRKFEWVSVGVAVVSFGLSLATRFGYFGYDKGGLTVGFALATVYIHSEAGSFPNRNRGWFAEEYPVPMQRMWIPRLEKGTGFLNFALPFWIPTAMGFAAAVLFHRKACRKSIHSCKCAYDLTGNVSGICPECGMPVSPGDTDKAPDDAGQPRRGE